MKRQQQNNEIDDGLGGNVGLLVKTLLNGFSIEMTTQEAHRITDFQTLLPPDTEIYIVATPTTKPNDVIQLATRLYQEGMIPVPHIAARAIPNKSLIDQWLYQLKREAHVNRALIIAGGNYDKPLGPFASSLELIESNVLTDNGITDLRYAAHPEGHPLLTDAQLMEILLEKQKISDELGYQSSLVTQFFFDFAPVAAWERRLRQYGVNMPIRVGFHGVVGMASLVKHALYCGVGPSLNQLMADPSKMIKTTMAAKPDNLILCLVNHCNKYPDNLFSGCHFFPFGNLATTCGWLDTVR